MGLCIVAIDLHHATSLNGLGNYMKRSIAVLYLIFAVLLTAGEPQLIAQQSNTTPYLRRAPIRQYLMSDRNGEILLARSAAPESISRDAEILVLGPKGYETAIKGTNGFECLVERSWGAKLDDPEFWNPKIRGPVCYNPPAVHSYLPITIRKTELVLAGRSKAEMSSAIETAFSKKELPPLESSAMCYMLSKEGYLNDRDGHWHPHLMLFIPHTAPAVWGANLPGSPVFSTADGHITVLLIPVAHWSDGTLAPP
jgi:hypothetical protein